MGAFGGFSVWVFLVCFGGFGGVEFVHLGFLFIGLSEVGFLGGWLVFVCFFLFYFHCNILSLLAFSGWTDRILLVGCVSLWLAILYHDIEKQLGSTSEVPRPLRNPPASSEMKSHLQPLWSQKISGHFVDSSSVSFDQYFPILLWALDCWAVVRVKLQVRRTLGGWWQPWVPLFSFFLGPFLLQLNLYLIILPALASLRSLLCQPRDDKILDISKNTLISKNKAAVENVKESLNDNSFN